jgi:hypothetical protein
VRSFYDFIAFCWSCDCLTSDSRPNQYAIGFIWYPDGIRCSLKLIPAEAIGYLIAISTWGMMIDHVSKTFALLPTILKLQCILYFVFGN